MGDFLKWRQIRNHPTLSATWKTSYANKLGSLCQGIGAGPKEGKCVKGTSTLFPIPYDKIPSKEPESQELLDLPHMYILKEATYLAKQAVGDKSIQNLQVEGLQSKVSK
jgi:hypothetical protein